MHTCVYLHVFLWHAVSIQPVCNASAMLCVHGVCVSVWYVQYLLWVSVVGEVHIHACIALCPT